MFFTTTFVFMFLEALHTYSLVAFVVKKDGMMTKQQNILVGWGVGVGITLTVVSFRYADYGGKLLIFPISWDFFFFVFLGRLPSSGRQHQLV